MSLQGDTDVSVMTDYFYCCLFKDVYEEPQCPSNSLITSAVLQVSALASLSDTNSKTSDAYFCVIYVAQSHDPGATGLAQSNFDIGGHSSTGFSWCNKQD